MERKSHKQPQGVNSSRDWRWGLKIIWEKAMPRSHPHHLDTHRFLPTLLFLNNSCKHYSSYSLMFYNAPFNLALPHHPLARTSAPSPSLDHTPKPHCILQGVFLWGLCWEVVEKKKKKKKRRKKTTQNLRSHNSSSAGENKTYPKPFEHHLRTTHVFYNLPFVFFWVLNALLYMKTWCKQT